MKPHILIIDDSESVRQAMTNVLSKRDYTISSVSSGSEGLSYIEQHQCDLILLDYSLPDIDGLDLLQNVTKRHAEIPIIMVTGTGSERLAVNALKSGASDYLVKSSDFISKIPHIVRDNLDKYDMKRRNRNLENQLRDSYKQLKQLNRELEEKVSTRTEELERAYQLSNELMAKAVDSNMQLAELYTEVDESRRKLDAKIRELSLLNEIGKIIASTSDKDQLLQTALDAIHEELGVEHCAILLINEETHRLQIGASYGTPDDLLLAARSLDGKRILWDVIKRGAPLLVDDIEFDDHFRPLIQDYPGVECSLLIPMRVENYEIGLVSAYGYEHHATFTQSDLDFVFSLTSHASIVLANIGLTVQRIQNAQMNVVGKVTSYLVRDLRPSLISIQNNVDRTGNNELGASEKQRISRMIIDDIDRAVGTMDELLEFSQGQPGQLDYDTWPVKEFVEEIIANIEPNFTSQRINIHQKLEYHGDFHVDRKKMRHVFLSIADNARHAMPKGGNFTVVNRLVDNVLHFEFTDDGYGISPETQARIFMPFVNEAENYDIGLGMSIVKKIIDEHGAHIEVQGIAEKGTTIHISLPQPQ